MKSFPLLILALIALTFVQLSSPADAAPGGYTVTVSSGASIVPGTTDVGNHCDDCLTNDIALPFPVMFYDQVFTTFDVSSNGHLTFTSANNGDYNFCLPHNIDYLIVPLSGDLLTADAPGGQGIFTSVSGVAPDRIFNIEWRTQNCCIGGPPVVNFEVRLYEGQRRIDFIYGSIADNSSNYGIGVQGAFAGGQSTIVSCGSVPAAGTQYTFTAPQTCADVPPNMTAWWRGDGNADDSIGGHNGSLMGGATFAAGEVGQGFSFDGVAAHVSVPSPAGNFGAGDFTFDFWMRTTASGDAREIINKRLCGDGNSHAFDLRMQSGGSLLLELVRNGDPANSFLYSTGAYNDGQFHHIAVVRSGDTLSLYVDGALDNSITHPNVGATNINSNVPLGIGGGGCSDPGGDGSKTFQGVIDEVELFNRALGAGEIAGIYNAGPLGKCECTTPPGGMVGWWPGEGNGDDIKGGNTVSGTNTYAAGEVNQAFSFNGSGYMSAGNPASLQLTTAAVTLDAWVNPTAPGQNTFIAGKTASSFNDYVLYLSGGTLVGGIKTGGTETFIGGVPLPTNAWSHVALTYDGSTFKLFINGGVVDSRAASGNVDGTNSEFAIGGRSGDTPLNGLVDEVEVFNTGLSDADILRIYQAGSAGKCRPCTAPPNGMVSWWPGDNSATDIQGGHHGTLQNGAGFAPAEVAQGFNLNGVDQYVEVSDSPSLSITGPMTIDAWINTNDITSEHAIVEKYDGGGFNGYFFRINDTGHLVAGMCDGSGFSSVTGATQVTTGTFHHVAAVFDGTNLQVYLDGVSDGTASSIAPTDGTNPLTIGARGGSVGNFFNGMIDEVEIFNVPLDGFQIAAIYDAGSGGKCKPPGPAERQLANISSRVDVGTNDNVGIGGFIIKTDPPSGTTSSRATRGDPVVAKEVLIRGLGPSLEVGGVPLTGRLMDPVLDLYDSNGTLLEHNDNWMEQPDGTVNPVRTAAIQGTGLAPSDPSEAAIVRNLPTDSGYTAILSGKDSSTGIGLVEVYDLQPTTDTHLANISTRAFVSTGDSVLIDGFIVEGGTPTRMLVRAIGPSLPPSVANRLEDPVLELYDNNGALLERNDDWMNSPEATDIGTILPPGDPKDSAILFTPAPGGYTAIVSGNNPNPTGVALVETYRVANP